ncbi:hypothetical protein ASF16_03160 [Acidovorax sp. Leaf78]|nr:hypothetical protein ASF16_03160 [Acidovorax sp. Leaf78]
MQHLLVALLQLWFWRLWVAAAGQSQQSIDRVGLPIFVALDLQQRHKAARLVHRVVDLPVGLGVHWFCFAPVLAGRSV